MFQPDVESLIKPIRIDKPQEEFILPGEVSPNAPGAELPTPVVRTTPLSPIISQQQALMEEAARVQDLMDLLTATTPTIEVSIPEEDQPLLGAKTVTTQDYLAAAADSSPNAVRLRHHFEWGLLQGCGGSSSIDWPVLAMPDLHSIQSDLVDAANVVEGSMFAQTPIHGPGWQSSASGSHLAAVNDTLLQGAKSYRLKLAQATFTLKQDATSNLLQKMMDPMIQAEVTSLRPVIISTVNALKTLRNLLCHAQFLRSMEYRGVRDALLSAVESAVLKQLLNAFLVVLSQTENALIQPVLHLFEQGLGNGPILHVLGDAASQEIATVCGSTMLALKKRYNDQAADLIRAMDRTNQQRLLKLHVLGERNLINRWVQHLDKGILILRKALSQQTTISQSLARSAAGAVLQTLDQPKSPLLDQLSQHPELSVAQETPLFNRDFTPTPITGLDGQIRGSFGNLQLTPNNFQTPGENASRPSFTGVSSTGQQSQVLET